MMTTLCGLPDCTRPAVVTYRVRPRRDREPLTDAVRRALAWPGLASPVDVTSCSPCAKRVKEAGQVLQVTSVGDDVDVRKL